MLNSSFLRAIDSQARRVPEGIAFCNSAGEKISYAQLKAQSDALALFLASDEQLRPDAPVLVFGHKAPWMLVCFLALAKAGHAYVPVDVSFPARRVQAICAQVGDAYVLDTTPDGRLGDGAEIGARVCPLARIEEACAQKADATAVEALEGTGPDDPFYLLFTSGSTGVPKGVVVPTSCIDNFSEWMVQTFGSAEHQTYFNRAPFSFDLSVTDYALALPQGHTMFALVEEDEGEVGRTFAALAKSGITWWVSTPSTIDLCLVDPSFDASLLPQLRTTFFVGETLKPQTVRLIYERFPEARAVNAYGPTESTDLVSWCWITPEMLAEDVPLPIGRPREGTRFYVLDPETLEEMPCGERGELFIVGDTVATGYYQLPEQTAAAFGSTPAELVRPGERGYRTGDAASAREDGLYDFYGRLDLQIKLHGYRIELGEIESQLAACPEVRAACVVCAMRDGSVSHLTAFVVPADGVEKGFALTRALKAQLKGTLPAYMVPRSFKYLEELPLSGTSKVDRKTLTQMASSSR